MRLITNYTDFFMGCSRSDTDKETTLVLMNKEPIDFIDLIGVRIRADWHYKTEEFVIGFAGRFFPGKIYFQNEVIYASGPRGRSRDIIDFRPPEKETNYNYRWDKKKTIWEFDWSSAGFLFDKYGPIFIITGGMWNAQHPRIEVCPKLESMGFAKILPPHEAWNELTKWRYNRAMIKDIPEMSNDIKIESHGFDLKTSFRKGKAQ